MNILRIFHDVIEFSGTFPNVDNLLRSLWAGPFQIQYCVALTLITVQKERLQMLRIWFRAKTYPSREGPFISVIGLTLKSGQM